jgi:hypothetical protein
VYLDDRLDEAVQATEFATANCQSTTLRVDPSVDFSPSHHHLEGELPWIWRLQRCCPTLRQSCLFKIASDNHNKNEYGLIAHAYILPNRRVASLKSIHPKRRRRHTYSTGFSLQSRVDISFPSDSAPLLPPSASVLEDQTILSMSTESLDLI